MQASLLVRISSNTYLIKLVENSRPTDKSLSIKEFGEMTSQFHIEVRPTYIFTEMSGTFQLDKFKDLLKESLSACAEHDKSKLLIDIRTLEGEVAIFERYELATYFANLSQSDPKTMEVQVAVVGYTPIVDPNRFGEKVAVNRGVNAKVTTDITEAYNWLQVDPVDKPDNNDQK